MPYLHQSVCISPQKTYPVRDLSSLQESAHNLLKVVEPEYPGLPAGLRRRMGKSVRMAAGAAIPVLENLPKPDGIVIATANGGMEDCIKFLNQIVEYKEGLLTPAGFVQSTSNAAAAQIALFTKNHNYNITHVHRGLAFENAMLDVIMLLEENPEADYLLGCTDEISAYNYNIDRIDGWFREEPVLNRELFNTPANGTIAGEGAYMVRVNNQPEGAIARIKAVKTIHTHDATLVLETMEKFLFGNSTKNEMPDLLLTGENGDKRVNHFFEQIESHFAGTIPVARFKHLCGEYCTASSFACWLSTEILQSGKIPDIMLKSGQVSKPVQRILIYNNYRAIQHSFILISAV